MRTAKNTGCVLNIAINYGSRAEITQAVKIICKDVIDEIDDALAKVYGLNSEELNYVKLFAIKYRSGGGNDD